MTARVSLIVRNVRSVDPSLPAFHFDNLKPATDGLEGALYRVRIFSTDAAQNRRWHIRSPEIYRRAVRIVRERFLKTTGRSKRSRSGRCIAKSGAC